MEQRFQYMCFRIRTICLYEARDVLNILEVIWKASFIPDWKCIKNVAEACRSETNYFQEFFFCIAVRFFVEKRTNEQEYEKTIEKLQCFINNNANVSWYYCRAALSQLCFFRTV